MSVIGLIIGLVLGLGVALGIAVYVTKVPIPFMTKTQRGGAEQDEAEARKNQNWDPNGPLAGKAGAARAAGAPAPATAPRRPPRAPQPASVGPLGAVLAAAHRCRSVAPSTPPVPVTVALPSTPRTRAGAGRGQRAAPFERPDRRLRPRAHGGGGPNGTATDPFIYFVQAGAYRTPEDAEAQRAKLSLMGVEARGHRARAGRPHGLPGARGPLQPQGRSRPAQGSARRRRPRDRPGARPALSLRTHLLRAPGTRSRPGALSAHRRTTA